MNVNETEGKIYTGRKIDVESVLGHLQAPDLRLEEMFMSTADGIHVNGYELRKGVEAIRCFIDFNAKQMDQGWKSM